jgi:plastocyanin
MRNLSALLVVAVSAVALLALPAVGTAAPQAATSIVKVSALPSGLMFNTKVLRAHAGTIKLVFTNRSTLRHNVRIESGENELGGTKTIAKGSTTAVLKLKKGTYNFYCSVPGHEDAGMKGKLIVS